MDFRNIQPDLKGWFDKRIQINQLKLKLGFVVDVWIQFFLSKRKWEYCQGRKMKQVKDSLKKKKTKQ